AKRIAEPAAPAKGAAKARPFRCQRATCPWSSGWMARWLRAGARPRSAPRSAFPWPSKLLIVYAFSRTACCGRFVNDEEGGGNRAWRDHVGEPEALSANEELARLQHRVEELTQQLATSEHKLRLLICVTSDAVAITDQGIIVDV